MSPRAYCFLLFLRCCLFFLGVLTNLVPYLGLCRISKMSYRSVLIGRLKPAAEDTMDHLLLVSLVRPARAHHVRLHLCNSRNQNESVCLAPPSAL